MPYHIKIYIDPWTFPDNKEERQKLYDAIEKIEDKEFRIISEIYEFAFEIWPNEELDFEWRRIEEEEV